MTVSTIIEINDDSAAAIRDGGPDLADLLARALMSGRWEAEVIGINGCVFSLRWRDYSTQPTILRKANELALLPPGEA